MRDEPLSPQELLALAELDALLLLNQYEAAQFERSFFGAPEHVRQQLRELQAEIVSIPVLHAVEEPPAELMERVVDRVMRSVAEHDDWLRPLLVTGPSERRPTTRDAAVESLRRALWILPSTVMYLGREASVVTTDTLGLTRRAVGGAVAAGVRLARGFSATVARALARPAPASLRQWLDRRSALAMFGVGFIVGAAVLPLAWQSPVAGLVASGTLAAVAVVILHASRPVLRERRAEADAPRLREGGPLINGPTQHRTHS